MNPLLNSPKNWTEDFSHENGNYMCRCIACKEYFLGHKRRVVCKECHNPVTLDNGAWYDVAEGKAYREFMDKLQGKKK